MALYKVTVSIRGVVRVQAGSDGIAGTVARDYLAGLLDLGQSACPAPPDVCDAHLDALVAAVSMDDSKAA